MMILVKYPSNLFSGFAALLGITVRTINVNYLNHNYYQLTFEKLSRITQKTIFSQITLSLISLFIFPNFSILKKLDTSVIKRIASQNQLATMNTPIYRY